MKNRSVYSCGPSDEVSLPPEAVAFTRRARLLDATVREVAAHGYANVSVATIAERARLPRHAFYAHFASKREAIIFAYDLAAAFTVPRILAAFRRERDWAGGARAALATYLAILDCDHAWTVACLRELTAAGPDGIAAQDAIRNPIVEAIQASAPTAGVPGVAAFVAAVDAIVIDTLHRWDGTLSRDERMALVAKMITPFVGPEGLSAQAESWASPVPCTVTAAPDAVIDGLDRPESQRELDLLVRAAVARRDGPALWRILLGLRRHREAGQTVPPAIERELLDGLEDAWAFGLFRATVSLERR